MCSAGPACLPSMLGGACWLLLPGVTKAPDKGWALDLPWGQRLLPQGSCRGTGLKSEHGWVRYDYSGKLWLVLQHACASGLNMAWNAHAHCGAWEHSPHPRGGSPRGHPIYAAHALHSPRWERKEGMGMYEQKLGQQATIPGKGGKHALLPLLTPHSTEKCI